MQLLLVSIGGAAGSAARFCVSLFFQKYMNPAFPLATLAVNALGSFLIAFIIQLAQSRAAMSVELRLFLTTGVMGGFTTYSAYNQETLELFRAGNWAAGVSNIILTIVICLLAGVLGFALAPGS